MKADNQSENASLLVDANSAIEVRGTNFLFRNEGTFYMAGFYIISNNSNGNRFEMAEGSLTDVFGVVEIRGNTELILQGELNGTGSIVGFTQNNISPDPVDNPTINGLDFCEAMDSICVNKFRDASDNSFPSTQAQLDNCGCGDTKQYPAAPWRLDLVGNPFVRWDGNQWQAEPPYNNPESLLPNFNIRIDGYYQTNDHKQLPPINDVQITTNGELVFEGDTTILIGGDVYNEGIVRIKDRQLVVTGRNNGAHGSGDDFNNIGQVFIEDHGALVTSSIGYLDLNKEDRQADFDGEITLERYFDNDPGWKFFSFPASSTSSLQITDFNLTGPGAQFGTTDWEFIFAGTVDFPNSTNVFFWNEDKASWDFLDLNTRRADLFGNAFLIYVPDAPDAFMELEMSNADFNVSNTNFNNLAYGDGNTSSPIVNFTWTIPTKLDGWLMVPNPWQASIEASVIIDNFGVGSLQSDAVYVYNGSSYQVSNGTTGDFDFVAPNKAFFVQRVSSGSALGSPVTLNQEMRSRVTTEGIAVRSAQRNLTLNLSGANYSVNTYISENHLAEDIFEGAFDAYYHRGIEEVPVFNSVTDDSIAVAINTVNEFFGKQIYLTFSHKDAGEQFTISLDGTELPMGMQVELTDLYLNQSVELTEQDYNFLSNLDAPAERFLLSFYGSAVSTAKNAEKDRFAKTWFINDELRIEKPGFEGSADVTVTDMNGRVLNHTVMSGSTHETTVRGAAGVYIVTINHGGKAYRSKVVKY